MPKPVEDLSGSEAEGGQEVVPMKNPKPKVVKAVKRPAKKPPKDRRGTKQGFTENVSILKWKRKPLPHFALATRLSQRSLSLRPYLVKLQKATKLNLEVVVPACKKALKKNGAKIFHGTKIMRSWSTIRCFSGTTTACSSDEVSARGITDLGNQVKFSKEYQSYVAQGHAAGRFLSVAAGEWFSGLCRGWTSPEPGSVDREVFTSMWPKAMNTAGKQPMISLFSGVGGLDLGLSEYMYPICYVESSEDCRQILRARMSDQCLHSAPIANDVTDYDPRASGHEWATGAGGGFPCQGTSCAGSQRGLQDSRTGLVKHTFKVYDRLEAPFFLYLENVASVLGSAPAMRKVMWYIIQECAARGLLLMWSTICLAHCGLAAQRGRVFFLAMKPGTALWKDVGLKPLQQVLPADWNSLNRQPLISWLEGERKPQDAVRMHALGNIVVPQQAQTAFPILLQMFKEQAMM